MAATAGILMITEMQPPPQPKVAEILKEFVAFSLSI
jgi:hypothetical protein